ncbi:MAG: hypothetical protein ACP5KS_02980 [Candidatus Hydrogenedens sp.]
MVKKCSDNGKVYYYIDYKEWKKYIVADKKKMDSLAAKLAKERLYYLGNKIGAKVKLANGPQSKIAYIADTIIGKIPTEDDVNRLIKQIDVRIANYIKDREVIDDILRSRKTLGHYDTRYFGKCKYILYVETPHLFAPIDTFKKVSVSIKNVSGVYDYKDAMRWFGYFENIHKEIKDVVDSDEYHEVWEKFTDRHKIDITLHEGSNPNHRYSYQEVDAYFIYEITNIPSNVIKEYVNKIYKTADEWTKRTGYYKHLDDVKIINDSTVRVIFK